MTAQVGEAFGRTAAAHRGLVAADLDDDGRQDLVTTSLGGPVEVWRNGGPAGHWLRDRPARPGIESRRARRDHHRRRPALLDDVSVRLRVVGAAGRARRTRVGHESCPRIEVHWPSGRKQVVEVTGVDRIVEVTEPEA